MPLDAVIENLPAAVLFFLLVNHIDVQRAVLFGEILLDRVRGEEGFLWRHHPVGRHFGFCILVDLIEPINGNDVMSADEPFAFD
mgnify:CR=1 FL=1